MNASNDFHSTISNNFFLRGFLRPKHQSAYGSRSTGGFAPTLRTVFLGASAASSLAAGADPPC